MKAGTFMVSILNFNIGTLKLGDPGGTIFHG